MKSRITPWIIAVPLVLAATAASAEHKHYTEYKGYTAFSIENRGIDLKTAGMKSDARLMQVGLRAGLPILPYVTLEGRYSHGLGREKYPDNTRLELDGAASALVLLGPTVKQEGYLKPYVALGWSLSNATYSGTVLGTKFSRSIKADGATAAAGITLYGSRPDQFSSVWGTRPDVGINLEYIYVLDDKVKIAGQNVDTKISGLSLAFVKRW